MSRAPKPRLTEGEMIALTVSALGKVNWMGVRGATLVSVDEIEAMCAALTACGWIDRVAAAIDADGIDTSPTEEEARG